MNDQNWPRKDKRAENHDTTLRFFFSEKSSSPKRRESHGDIGGNDGARTRERGGRRRSRLIRSGNKMISNHTANKTLKTIKTTRAHIRGFSCPDGSIRRTDVGARCAVIGESPAGTHARREGRDVSIKGGKQ